MKKMIMMVGAALFGAVQAWGATVECSTWAEVKTALEAGNSVKLTQDISQGWTMAEISGKTVTLDLNGWTITGSSNTAWNYRIAKLVNGANLTLTDSSAGKTGTIDGGNYNRTMDGGCVAVGTDCSFTMTGGTITKYKTALCAGGAINNSGTLKIDGGTIANCTSVTNGGAIWNANVGTFTMKGGTIKDCSCSVNGGAVYNEGVMTMNGGTFSGCQAIRGTVYNAGTFTMNGGTFSGNTVCMGGAVYNNSTASIYGGVIKDNTAKKISGGPNYAFGGAFYCNKTSKTYIYGGFFSGNTAPSGCFNLCSSAGDNAEGYLYGGVFAADPTSTTESTSDFLVLQNGAAVTQVGSKWVVGKSVVSDANNQLTAGTYTFCPTNAEYVAAGVVDASKVAATGSGTNYTLQATGAVDVSDWAQMKANLEAGNSVKLTQDVSQGDEDLGVKIGNDDYVTLDLNGHTLFAGTTNLGNGNYRPLTCNFMSPCSMTIIDSSKGKTGAIDGRGVTRTYGGSCFFTSYYSSIKVEGGTIKNFVGTDAADGRSCLVDDYAGGTFDMTGGTITNCTTGSSVGLIYSGHTIDGGVFVGNTAVAIFGTNNNATVNGAVSDSATIGIRKAAGKDCIKVGSLYVVGTDVSADANGKLLTGTYTFCPTNAEYAAVGLALSSQSVLTESATTPKTWTVVQTSVSVAIPSVTHATVTNITVNGASVAVTTPVVVPTNSTIVVYYKADTDYAISGDKTATLTNVTEDNKTIDVSKVTVVPVYQIEVDTSSTYKPTQIVNGGFDTRPFEAYKYNNVVYTSWPEKDQSTLHGVPWQEVYPNGVNGGWNSTEITLYCGGLFEYKDTPSTYGLTWSNGGFIEMNAFNSAVFSQDLSTQGGDVILWTLKHAARRNQGDNPQKMKVEVGAPQTNAMGIVAATGVGNATDAKLQAATTATYTESGVTNPSGATYGYAKTAELAALSVYMSGSTDQNAWKDARGVYVIPEGQTVTRFAFTAIGMANPGCGNLLDDITFSTLIGNLKARVNDDGTVTITGYWGDSDASKKLMVKIGDGEAEAINMSGVLNKNFKITVAADKIGLANVLEVYHQDYEQAKRSVIIGWSVTLNLNAADATCAKLTEYQRGAVTVLPIPTRPSYRFDGWFTNSVMTGTAVTQIPADATGAKEFWAKWYPVVSVEIPSVTHATVTNITVDGEAVAVTTPVVVPSNSTIVVYYKPDEGYLFTGDSTATLSNVTPDNKTIDASGVKVRTIILYYVSATGNDGNAGTVAAPLKTLAAAYNRIAAAGSIGTIALLSDITVPSGTSHAMDVADGKCIIITSATSDGTLLDNAAGDYTGVWTIKRGSCTATIIDVTAASSLTLRHVVMSGEGKRFTASTKLEYPLIRATDGTASVITMDTNSILRDNRPTGSYSTRGGAVEIGTDVDSGICPTAFYMVSNAAMIGNEAARHGGAVTAYNCDFYMTDDARMEYNGINMVGGEYFGGGAILAYSARIHMSGNATIAHNYVQLNGCGDGGRMHNTLQIDPDRTVASLDVRDNVRVFDNYDNGNLTRNADGSYTLTGTIAANVLAGAGKMTITGAMGDEAKIGVTVKNAAVNSVIANGTSAYAVTSEDANQFFDDSGTYTVIKHSTNNQLVFGSAVTSVTLTLGSLTTTSLSGTFSADIGATANDITVFKDGVKMEGGYALTVSGTALAIAFDPALPKTVTIGVAVSKNGYKVNNGQVVYSELHQHCICGDGECTAGGHEHADIKWQKWTNTTSLPTSAGNYYLANDVTLSAASQPATGVAICLNGHDIRVSGTSNFVYLNNNVAFTVTDCGTALRYATDPNGDGAYETIVAEEPTSGAYFPITGGGFIGGSNNEGGTIYARGKGCVFTLYRGNIVGHNCTHIGGAVGVMDGTFNMYGGLIGGCRASSRNMAVHDWYGYVNVYGGTFCNNNCAIFSENNNIKIYGGLFTRHTGTVFSSWGSVNIYGGDITGNTTSSHTLNVGVAYLQDCFVTNNTMTGAGAAAVVNPANIGGGVVVKGNVNTADSCERNVYLNTGRTATISKAFVAGGSVGITTQTKPTAGSPVALTSNRGEDCVYFTSDDPLYSAVDLDGVVKLADQRISVAIPSVTHATVTNIVVNGELVGAAASVYVPSNGTITVLYKPDDGYVSTGDTSATLTNVSEDNKTIDVSKVTVKWHHTHCICGDGECTATGHVHADVEWQKWTYTTSLPTSAGNYYLVNNVTLSSTYQPVNGVNICLNGKVVKQTAAASVITVNAGVNLTLTDCQETEHKYVVDSSGVWGWNDSASGGTAYEELTARPAANDVIIVKGGAITGGHPQYNGGGICYSGNVTLHHVNIVGNKTTAEGGSSGGGGLFNISASSLITLTMNGAKVIGNYSADWGGGIHNETLNGTYKADTYRRIYMTGGAEISFNNVRNAGGAVYTYSYMDMEKGSALRYNYSGRRAGAVAFAGTAMSVVDSQIVGNYAGSSEGDGSGAIKMFRGTLTFGGTTVVTNNFLGSAKVNVYLPSGLTTTVSTATPLTADAKIGVKTATAPTTGKPVAVTGSNAADVSDFFFSDNTAYYADNGANNVVQLAVVASGPTVKDKDNKDVVVVIPTEWRQNQKATPEEVMKPTKKMKNGHPAWQNYVLGIDPTNELSGVYADAPQNKTTDSVTIETKNITSSKVASGYEVKYRLDTKLRGAAEYTKGANQTAADFDISITGDDPTGVYKLNAVIFSNGVEIAQSAEALNTVGLVKATNTNRFAIVAVPWSRLAPGEEEEIAVSNVLKTATLEAGDKLHVFNRLAKTYDTWTLNAQKEWDSVQTFAIAADGTLSASVSGASATETIARGSGIWLERMNPTNAPYFLYGQVSASELPAILPGHNLVGAPGVEAFDFSRVKGAAEGDQILVPGVVPKLYELKNGVWGYFKTIVKEINVKGTIKTSFKAEWTTTENTIPAGTGYWLINKSGNVITIE